MQEWVPLTTVILDDATYFSYIPGCDALYSGTATQRNAAYLMAEQAMVEYIGAPLEPTAITGTFMWPSLRGRDAYSIAENTIKLPHKWLQSVNRVAVLYGGGTGTCGLQTTAGCHMVRDSIGYVDVFCIGNLVRQQCSSVSDPYQVQITYTAGLPIGVRDNDLSLHMALAIVAEEHLMEMIDPGANPGGPGAPGVMSYSSMGYSEKANPEVYKVTALGNSARANFAAKKVRHLKKKRAMRFG